MVTVVGFQLNALTLIGVLEGLHDGIISIPSRDYQVLGRSETELVYMANYMSGQLNKISKAHEVLSELESL